MESKALQDPALNPPETDGNMNHTDRNVQVGDVIFLSGGAIAIVIGTMDPSYYDAASTVCCLMRTSNGEVTIRQYYAKKSLWDSWKFA